MKAISILLLMLSSAVLSCHGGSNREAYAPAAEEAKASAGDDLSARNAKLDLSGDMDLTQQPPGEASADAAPVERKIIKTVNYRIQVKDVNASTEKVKQLVATQGGYISGMSLNNSSYEISNDITIRVPQEKLDALLDAIAQEAIYTNYRSEQAQDVTEEYIDLEIRLKTKKEVRDRYIDILRNKAKTVEDVLNAEEKIRVIQEEIESVEGRLKFLNNQVALSTINLTIYQRVEYQPEPDIYHESFANRLVKSLQLGWELLQGLVLFLIRIWPLLILFGLVIWQRKRLFRRFRR